MSRLRQTVCFAIFQSLVIASYADTQNIDEKSLLRAFQREKIFLKTQLRDLNEQLEKSQLAIEATETQVKDQIEEHKVDILSLNRRNQDLNKEVGRLESQQGMLADNRSSFQTTLSRVGHDLGLQHVEGSALPSADEIKRVFQAQFESLRTASSLNVQKSGFYDESGQWREAEVTHIGEVASVGYLDGQFYLLAPAGEGKLKVWDASIHIEGQGGLLSAPLQTLYLYESRDKPVMRTTDKSVRDFLSAGGSIAWVIVALGGFALILCLLRFVNLKAYQNEAQKISVFSREPIDGFQQFLDRNRMRYSIGNFLLKLKKLSGQSVSENELESVVEEGVIEEHKAIDRYGSMILVFAAVAPLLGLLGTVTGMISTFEVITEFGTGDPKLLSQGISEALITTELGLIVAIPLLLLGHLLGNWGRRLKVEVEKFVLGFAHSSNTVESVET